MSDRAPLHPEELLERARRHFEKHKRIQAGECPTCLSILGEIARSDLSEALTQSLERERALQEQVETLTAERDGCREWAVAALRRCVILERNYDHLDRAHAKVLEVSWPETNARWREKVDAAETRAAAATRRKEALREALDRWHRWAKDALFGHDLPETVLERIASDHAALATTPEPPPAPEPDEVDAAQELRLEWWLNHGHSIPALYGDDGEMQCHACPADFKRQHLSELKALVDARRLEPWVGFKPVPENLPGEAPNAE